MGASSLWHHFEVKMPLIIIRNRWNSRRFSLERYHRGRCGEGTTTSIFASVFAGGIKIRSVGFNRKECPCLGKPIHPFIHPLIHTLIHSSIHLFNNLFFISLFKFIFLIYLLSNLISVSSESICNECTSEYGIVNLFSANFIHYSMRSSFQESFSPMRRSQRDEVLCIATTPNVFLDNSPGFRSCLQITIHLFRCIKQISWVMEQT